MWTKKSWEAPDVANGSYKPTKLSFEQGKALEKKNLRKYHGLTADSKGGIIKTRDVSSRNLPSTLLICIIRTLQEEVDYDTCSYF